MRLSSDPCCRLSRLSFAMAMLVAWCAPPPLPAAPAPPAPSRPAEVTPKQLTDAAAGVERAVAAMDAMIANVPRDTFDPQAVVASVGKDPAALQAWARDHTALVPYAGALRGPVGVLMDRSGNGLDRALLVARLVQLAGHRVRLAHATLPPERAEALLAAPPPALAPPPTGSLDAEDAASIKRVAAAARVDAQALDRAVRLEAIEDEKADERLLAAAAEQAEALEAALGDVVTAGGDGADTRAAAALAAAREHWWAQYAGPDGAWHDLDLAADTPPATETKDLPADWDGTPPAGVPTQTVELRVTVEQFSAGKLNPPAVVMSQTLAPAALAGRALTLRITPLDWDDKVDASAADGQRQVADALLKQWQWAPVLIIDGPEIIQKGFDVSGNVIDKPVLDPFKKTGKAVGGAASDALDAFKTDTPGPEAPAGVLAAVWLEVETRVPGQKASMVRRQVYDYYGPSRRAGGSLTEPRLDDAARLARSAALTREVGLLVTGATPSPQFVAHEAAANLRENGPRAAALFRAGASGAPPKFGDVVAQFKPFHAGIYYLATARRGPAAGPPPFVLTRPNVFALHQRFAEPLAGSTTPAPAQQKPRLVVRRTFDIISNAVEVTAPAAGADAFRARLRQGVLDTLLEREALRITTDRTLGMNTSAAYATARAASAAWVTLKSPDDPNLAKVKLSGDAVARIRDDLRAGAVVVAPPAPVASARGGPPRESWWRIDPRTGGCVGISAAADGAGAELAEKALLFVTILFAVIHGGDCYFGGQNILVCIGCGVVSIAIDVIGHFVPGAGPGIKLGAFGGAEAFGHACFHGGGHEGGEGGEH